MPDEEASKISSDLPKESGDAREDADKLEDSWDKDENFVEAQEELNESQTRELFELLEKLETSDIQAEATAASKND